MPPEERDSPQGDRKEHWLQADGPLRSRPWAYEALLFGSCPEREQAQELDAIVDDLQRERDALGLLYEVLNAHLERIATLERRLKELTPASEHEASPPVPATSLPRTQAAPADGDHFGPSLVQRSYSLARCEGFQVDSPAGPVGFVDGLRFVSRIDQPDLLEVRGGRFGRRLLLIPVEEVDEVRAAEEIVVLRRAPALDGNLAGELLDLVRGALRPDHAATSPTNEQESR